MILYVCQGQHICNVSAYELGKFQVSEWVRGLCITTVGLITLCEGALRGRNNIITYNVAGTRVHSNLTLPLGHESWSITRHANVTLVADRKGKQLLVISQGKLVTTMKFDILPSLVSSDDDSIWIYTRRERHVYRTDINTNYTAKELQNQTLQMNRSKNDVVWNLDVNSERLALCYATKHSVHVYSHYGYLLFVYGGQKGKLDNQLNYPYDVSLDDHNNLFIADCINRRVVIVGEDGKRKGYIHFQDEPRRLDVWNNILTVACRSTHAWTIYTYSLKWN